MLKIEEKIGVKPRQARSFPDLQAGLAGAPVFEPGHGRDNPDVWNKQLGILMIHEEEKRGRDFRIARTTESIPKY
ncbi:MAG: hypothetical protein R2856_29455 [Caldilineaceae bacterium]